MGPGSFRVLVLRSALWPKTHWLSFSYISEGFGTGSSFLLECPICYVLLYLWICSVYLETNEARMAEWACLLWFTVSFLLLHPMSAQDVWQEQPPHLCEHLLPQTQLSGAHLSTPVTFSFEKPAIDFWLQSLQSYMGNLGGIYLHPSPCIPNGFSWPGVYLLLLHDLQFGDMSEFGKPAGKGQGAGVPRCLTPLTTDSATTSLMQFTGTETRPTESLDGCGMQGRWELVRKKGKGEQRIFQCDPQHI